MMTTVQRYFEKEGMTVRLKPTLTGASGDAHTPDAVAEGAQGTYYIEVRGEPVTASATIPIHLAAKDASAAPVLVGLAGFTEEAYRWAARFGVTLVDGDTLAAACREAAPEVPLEAAPALDEPGNHASIVAALLSEPAPAPEAAPEPAAPAFVTTEDAWALTYEFPTLADISALLTPADAPAAEAVAADSYFTPEPAPAAEAGPAPEAEPAPADVASLDFSAIVAEVTHLLAEARGETLALVEAPPHALVEVVAPEPITVIEIAPEPQAVAASEAVPEFVDAAPVEAPVEEAPTVVLPEPEPAPAEAAGPLVTLVEAPAEPEPEAGEAPELLAAASGGAIVVEAPEVEAAAPAAPAAVDIWGAFAKPREEAPKPAPAGSWLEALAAKAN